MTPSYIIFFLLNNEETKNKDPEDGYLISL